MTNSTASVLFRQAVAILTKGPRLSMNIVLGNPEDLPDCIYTLHQGNIWAICMALGANPDLYDHEATTDNDEPPEDSQAKKVVWFLCRKFLFVHRVSESDGMVQSIQDSLGTVHYRLYFGRLFSKGPPGSALLGVASPQFFMMGEDTPKPTVTYRRISRCADMATNGAIRRMPSVRYIVGFKGDVMVMTNDGPFILGANSDTFHGVGGAGLVDLPARVQLDIEDRQTSPYMLASHHTRHKLVLDHVITDRVTVVVLDEGVFLGVRSADRRYFFDGDHCTDVLRRVDLPPDFRPTQVEALSAIVILTDDRKGRVQQMIAGENTSGRLGTVHEESVVGFFELPFAVTRIIYTDPDFVIYYNGYHGNFVFCGVDDFGLLEPFVRPTGHMKHFVLDHPIARVLTIDGISGFAFFVWEDSPGMSFISSTAENGALTLPGVDPNDIYQLKRGSSYLIREKRGDGPDRWMQLGYPVVDDLGDWEYCSTLIEVDPVLAAEKAADGLRASTILI
ncbi:hypothetical protein J8273_8697 [Carpediemonas membranifera]|uniref:Uncharacterized protein n=1 Tax=Carpediemonas membranifera TaxID=201153 RepID=A0A8J6BU60_9EUKA|nr:hypothetical protein J8273_8697 [Carpediemonas membranifera]|eukprot:KAG9390006.1 hypothetical protein J8273_8697 [Carpediemonas membranifera]